MSRHSDVIREAYTTVLFRMMEKGLTGPLHHRLALELTAEVVSKTVQETIAPADVEQTLSYEDA